MTKYEQSLVAEALSRHRNKIAAAASELGLQRTTLQMRMRKWGWTWENGTVTLAAAEEVVNQADEDEWVGAVLAAERNAERTAVVHVQEWLDVGERFGHVSSAAAMGLRSILGKVSR